VKPNATTLTAQVGAPIERVYAALTDPAAMARWLPAASAVEATEPGPVHRGGRMRVSFGARQALLEIVDHKPPYTFGWVEREGRPGAKTFFRLDWNGGSTAITVRDVWEPLSAAAWVKSKVSAKRDPKRTLDSMVQGLRAVLSRGA
jgi:hypothetical protein